MACSVPIPAPKRCWCWNTAARNLVLLDLMLPGLSGEALLPRLEGLPVIVVSAKAAVNDKVNLLLGGAADYLTKPFDTQELLARITVQLRRTTQPLGAIYSHGPLRLDSASHDVTADGRPVALTKTEYALLKLLMQHPGQVLAKSVDPGSHCRRYAGLHRNHP